MDGIEVTPACRADLLNAVASSAFQGRSAGVQLHLLMLTHVLVSGFSDWSFTHMPYTAGCW